MRPSRTGHAPHDTRPHPRRAAARPAYGAPGAGPHGPSRPPRATAGAAGAAVLVTDASADGRERGDDERPGRRAPRGRRAARGTPGTGPRRPHHPPPRRAAPRTTGPAHVHTPVHAPATATSPPRDRPPLAGPPPSDGRDTR